MANSPATDQEPEGRLADLRRDMAELRQRIADVRRRIPKHSVPTAIMLELDELEEALARLVEEEQRLAS